MIDTFRERYQTEFKQAGLTLPKGICEECATEVWKQQRRRLWAVRQMLCGWLLIWSNQLREVAARSHLNFG
jgi:hypothetical protein